jgi:hypothetical protein
MKRRRRWLFNGLAATLLLMCAAFVAVIALQFASHRGDRAFVVPIGPWATVRTFVMYGRLFLDWQPTTAYRPAWAGQTNHAGFRYNLTSNGETTISIPLSYAIACGFCIIAVITTRLVWCRSRLVRGVGLCTVCGYDLRATPDRCPECGTIPPKKEMISS